MKEQILKLRSEGKTYNEIKAILGCSKSTISYHCGSGQKEKNKERKTKHRRNNPLAKKIDSFKTQGKNKLEHKVNTFHRKRNSDREYDDRNFNYTDVIKKHGIETNCYLTGRQVNLLNGDSYELDHIVPKSKGGENTIDNCGITCPQANRGKGNILLEEFIKLCQDVLKNFGYKVEPPETNNNL
jgi:5-methylcytosine-specific restriction endonuclease McrA